ncbi:MAG TPA: hypothetical protein DCZ80_08180 [Legionellales bacterium]|nr:hypothetical protein [Legionellales bacterium]
MNRRTPEEFLSQAEAEEKQTQRGSLKIYLGAAPGVGKTYQMLSDALVKRSQGFDVVIGIIETHGRQEVESLASAFEKVPCKMVKKANFSLRALNLEAIYKRAPALVLVDEAAFSNPEGSLHPKRWQDILDILERGIDVYTTLNIQHLESLNDVVSRLVGIPIYETLPDAFLEQSAAIELIDLPSEELIARLKEGKVYLPTEVSVAIHHFFKKSNLDALRELALRIAAQRVSSDVLSDANKSLSARLLYQEDKLLVCVSHKPDMNRLIRAAKRIASRLNCPWHALYVDHGDKKSFAKIQTYLQFAQSLGAQTHVVFSTKIADAIENFVEQHHITQIVLGKEKNHWWYPSSVIEKLTFNLKDIGMYLIELKSDQQSIFQKIKQVLSLKTLVFSCLIMITAMVMVTLKNIFSPFDFGWLTGLFILAIAYFGAWRWVFFLMLLFLGFDLLFNERSFDFLMNEPSLWLWQYGSWSLLFLSLSAYLIHARKQVVLAREIEAHHHQLILFYQVISHARGIQAILKGTSEFLKKQFHIQTLFFMPDENSLRQVEPLEPRHLSEKEMAIVQWVFESGEEAGHGTGNLIFSDAYYLPIKTADSVLGVVRFDGHHQEIIDTQKSFLVVLIQQLSFILQLEKQQQQQKIKDIDHAKYQERDEILRKFSEQFYRPFSEITEKFADMAPDASYLKSLLRLKNHLKVIHYLSFEKSKERRIYQDIVKVIEQVLHENKKVWPKKKISWQIAEQIPELLFNYDLIYILIDNLLDNIAMHANPKAGIEISVQKNKDFVVVSFTDYGPGFSEKELEKIFESFYQGRQAQNTGLGLGLALCERIVTWHGGKIWAENRLPNGAVFYFSLPKNAE